MVVQDEHTDAVAISAFILEEWSRACDARAKITKPSRMTGKGGAAHPNILSGGALQGSGFAYPSVVSTRPVMPEENHEREESFNKASSEIKGVSTLVLGLSVMFSVFNIT